MSPAHRWPALLPLPHALLLPALLVLLVACGTGAGTAPDARGAGTTGAAGGGTTASATAPSTPIAPAAPVTGRADPGRDPGRDPGPDPQTGACRRLDWAQVLSPTDDSVPLRCRRSHTAETYSVGALRTLVDGHLLAVDSTAVQQQVSTRCPQRLASWAGGDRDDLRLSMLRPVWFTPTLAEADAGATWFRCDVVAVAREGAPAAVRGSLRGVLADPARAVDYAMCGTARPGSPAFERVVCRAEHRWRAVRVVDLRTSGRARSAAYPGVARVRAAGRETCEDAGRALASDALDFTWGYEWPTAEQWAAGQTYGRCWAPDPA